MVTSVNQGKGSMTSSGSGGKWEQRGKSWERTHCSGYSQEQPPAVALCYSDSRR